MITGGCFCKKIRYAIQEKPQGKYLVATCHCTFCRRTSGAPFVSWIILPRTAFHYESGEPRVLQSSDRGNRHFCADCGTPIAFFTTDRPYNIDVTTGSLDTPGEFVPTLQVHEESKLGWL
jgi:hypothetical protein